MAQAFTYIIWSHTRQETVPKEMWCFVVNVAGSRVLALNQPKLQHATRNIYDNKVS